MTRAARAAALLLTTTALEGGALGLVLFGLLPAAGMDPPGWLSALVLLGWASYEVLTFRPKLRALKQRPRFGPDRVVGMRGVALTELRREGRVQLGREIWRARPRDGVIPPEAEVEVVGRRGLILVVEAIPTPAPPPDRPGPRP